MGFNRINSGRSIPTSGGYTQAYDITGQVSIVSIQADQSRQGWMTCDEVSLVKFRSYQFRQINPDHTSSYLRNRLIRVSIVSIQADQSRRRI